MDQIREISERLREVLEEKNIAREQALKLSRECIRLAANSIRATHRAEWTEAEDLLSQSRARAMEAKDILQSHQDIYFAGYTQDAQKEYAEAELTMAIVRGMPLKTPEELGVEPAPYLNALGEAVGELRRHVLDVVRKGDLKRGEEILEVMDDAYFALITFDYPDAVTNGLRRTTDMVRGVLERTRSDLTVTRQQTELERCIADAVAKLKE